MGQFQRIPYSLADLAVTEPLCGPLVPPGQPYRPNPHEPYHVVFNFLVASGDPTYIQPGDEPPYPRKIRSLDPDSDHPPLPDYPWLHILGDEPVTGFENPLPYTTDETEPLARVYGVQDIAHPDRRGRLPKAIQFRFGNTGSNTFPETHVLKYNLDGAGSKYLALWASSDQNGDSLMLRLQYSFDPGFVVETVEYVTGWTALNTMSPTLQFVIRDDRLQLYEGQPGALVMELMFPPPIEITGPATLDLFSRIETDRPGVDNFLISDILIFDAYL